MPFFPSQLIQRVKVDPTENITHLPLASLPLVTATYLCSPLLYKPQTLSPSPTSNKATNSLHPGARKNQGPRLCFSLQDGLPSKVLFV